MRERIALPPRLRRVLRKQARPGSRAAPARTGPACPLRAAKRGPVPLLAGFAASRSGVSAVEFAIVLPVMLLLLIGGYTYGQLLSVNRKLTITTRALADLTTHYSSLTSTQVGTIMAASTQVFAPYNTSSLSIRISEIYVTAGGIAQVVWSQANANATAYTAGQIVTLPAGLGQLGSYVVWAQTGYTYTPLLSYAMTTSIPLSDQLIMIPRRSANIAYSS